MTKRKRPVRDEDTAEGVSRALHDAYDDLSQAQDERLRRLIKEMDNFTKASKQ